MCVTQGGICVETSEMDDCATTAEHVSGAGAENGAERARKLDERKREVVCAGAER